MINNKRQKPKPKIQEEVISSLLQNGTDSGRIANAMNLNIAAPKQLDLFDRLLANDSEGLVAQDKERLIDRRGKPFSLSVLDVQIIKALSSYIPFYSPDIRERISILDTMDEKGNVKELNPIQMLISIPQLAKDIKGDTKEKSLKVIAKALQRLSEARQPQTYHIKNNGKHEKYMITAPLISVCGEVYKCYSEIRSTRGRKKTDGESEERIMVAANVVYSSLFLYKATKEYCPLYKQRLFDVWKRNQTEIFFVLLSDLESKWRQYYIAGIKAKKKAEEDNKRLKKENQNEYYKIVATEKKKARIYQAETTTIRNRLETDYEGSRKMARQFIPDLQRAIDSLVEYGIITEETRITKDKQKVLFFYNPDFITDEMAKLLPEPKS